MAVTLAQEPGETSSFGRLLGSALADVRRVGGLPVAFGGAVARDKRGVHLTTFAGTHTNVLRGLAVTTGSGLGGRVLLNGRPGHVDDYALDARISHEYDRPVTVEGLRAIAAVPVVVNRAVLGILYGGCRAPATIGNRAIEAMIRAASRVAIEAAVHTEVERRLAVLDTEQIRRAARDTATTPEQELVREAHAELRSIAQEIVDPALRQRLDAVCKRLARPQGRRPTEVSPLSPRELDVLALIAVGCGNAEVAHRLGILPETVKSYLRSSMRKLGTHNRMETVVAARRTGLLP